MADMQKIDRNVFKSNTPNEIWTYKGNLGWSLPGLPWKQRHPSLSKYEKTWVCSDLLEVNQLIQIARSISWVQFEYLAYHLSCIVVITILHIKQKTKLILSHLLIAILIGLIILFQMGIIFNGLFHYFLYPYPLSLIIPLFIGVYVATGLSNKNKTIIGLSEGSSKTQLQTLSEN